MAIEYSPTSDHYLALGVGSTASHDEIKRAHRALIREVHPDRRGESLSAAQVNIARDILLDPVTRLEYDEARHEWHERNPLLSAFTDAGQQLHRERTQAQQGPAAEPRRSSAAESTQSWPQDAGSLHTPTAGWRSRIAISLVLDKLAAALLSGEWLKAADVIGSAYILDRVIGNRVGDDPEKRAVAEAIADSIQLHHAALFADALATEFRRRWDPVTGRWISSRPGKTVSKSDGRDVRPRGGRTSGTGARATRGRPEMPGRSGTAGAADTRRRPGTRDRRDSSAPTSPGSAGARRSTR